MVAFQIVDVHDLNILDESEGVHNTLVLEGPSTVFFFFCFRIYTSKQNTYETHTHMNNVHSRTLSSLSEI